MPRYSISNVPTDVVNNTPDPGYFGGDWGISISSGTPPRRFLSTLPKLNSASVSSYMLVKKKVKLR